jgi:hypothetical protein
MIADVQSITSTRYTVYLTSFPAHHKGAIVRMLRQDTGVGVSDAAEMLESLPVIVGRNLAATKAEKIREELTDIGASFDFLRSEPAGSGCLPDELDKPGARMALMVAEYVTIGRASQITGYTQLAIRSKIAGGVWLEGRVWLRIDQASARCYCGYSR